MTDHALQQLVSEELFWDPKVDSGAIAATVFQDAGFATIDLGSLATGGAMQQIHHPLAGVNLIQL